MNPIIYRKFLKNWVIQREKFNVKKINAITCRI